MINLHRTDSTNSDFISLVKDLDAYLAEKDGAEHGFYAQFNKVDMLKHVIVAYEDDVAVGCGAIKPYSDDTVEVKRMYVVPTARQKGIASQLLTGLEQWAEEMDYKRCILETGKRQPEAIALYHRCGYQVIPNYGQYEHIENSVCFEKLL